MKVQELLMNIKNKEFKLERGLEVKKYLPIEVKKTIAQGIIYDCTNEDSGVVKMDSVERYMSYVRYMITTHTNLEYADEHYDALCSTKYGEGTLLNAIMDCFGEDAKECTRILNLMTDDLIHDNSIECTVGRLLYKVGSLLGNISDSFEDKINDFNLKDFASGDVTIGQLKNILSLISE